MPDRAQQRRENMSEEVWLPSSICSKADELTWYSLGVGVRAAERGGLARWDSAAGEALHAAEPSPR